MAAHRGWLTKRINQLGKMQKLFVNSPNDLMKTQVEKAEAKVKETYELIKDLVFALSIREGDPAMDKEQLDTAMVKQIMETHEMNTSSYDKAKEEVQEGLRHWKIVNPDTDDGKGDIQRAAIETDGVKFNDASSSPQHYYNYNHNPTSSNIQNQYNSSQARKNQSYC